MQAKIAFGDVSPKDNENENEPKLSKIAQDEITSLRLKETKLDLTEQLNQEGHTEKRKSRKITKGSDVGLLGAHANRFKFRQAASVKHSETNSTDASEAAMDTVRCLFRCTLMPQSRFSLRSYIYFAYPAEKYDVRTADP